MEVIRIGKAISVFALSLPMDELVLEWLVGRNGGVHSNG